MLKRKRKKERKEVSRTKERKEVCRREERREGEKSEGC